MDPSIVIKVKYSKTLRRFNARLVDNGLEFNLDGLRNKIRGLFNFNPDADMVLTYLDEDKEKITLGGDEDLRDVVSQSLNPLRIFVTLKADNNSERTPSEKSETVTTPVQQNRLENFNTAALEFINSMPEPFCKRLINSLHEPSAGIIRKAINDLVSTSTSSRLSGVVQSVTEKGLASLRQLSESSPVSDSSAQQADAPATENTLKLAQDAHANAPATENTLKLAQEASSSNVQKQEKVLSKTWASVVSSNIPVAITEAQSAPKSHETPKSQVLETGEVVNSEGSKKKAISEESDLAVKTTSYLPSPLVGAYYHQPGMPHVSNPTAVEKVKNSPSIMASPSVPNTIPLFKRSIFKQPIAKPANVSSIPTAPRYLPVGDKRQPSMFKMPQSPSLSVGKTTSIGIPLVDHSSLLPREFLAQRNNGYTNASGVTFHRGIRCDGCGVHPITGTRFKSRVKDDYDLCRICMSQVGIESDYIRIDNPIAIDPYRRVFDFPSQLPQAPRAPQPSQLPQLGRAPQGSAFSGSGGGGLDQSVPQVSAFSCGGGVDLNRPKLDSRFVQDVTIFDGALMAPNTPFTKIWRMKNSGSIHWPMGTKLTWIGGDKMSDVFSVDLEITVNGFPVDHELDVAVDFVAPDRPGRYVSYWRMNSPSDGQNFGQRVWVLIQVDNSLVAVQQALHDFNLNNLPSNTRVQHDVFESIKDEVLHLAKPEFNFPLTDNLLVGGNGSGNGGGGSGGGGGLTIGEGSSGGGLTIGEGLPPVLYPMIDPIGSVSDGTFVAPPFKDDVSDQTVISLAPPVSDPNPDPGSSEKSTVTTEVEGDEDLEKSLLMELSSMGFREVDLNKEVLRSNKFDLEKSLNDLCGASEWDPILEELHEMGFYDDVMNRQLLEKNNGSVTQVVLDLLVEEN